MKYKSIAYWPRGAHHEETDCEVPAVSEDYHEYPESAEAVCVMLEAWGYGGDEKIFPVRTDVIEEPKQ